MGRNGRILQERVGQGGRGGQGFIAPARRRPEGSPPVEIPHDHHRQGQHGAGQPLDRKHPEQRDAGRMRDPYRDAEGQRQKRQRQHDDRSPARHRAWPMLRLRGCCRHAVWSFRSNTGQGVLPLFARMTSLRLTVRTAPRKINPWYSGYAFPGHFAIFLAQLGNDERISDPGPDSARDSGPVNASAAPGRTERPTDNPLPHNYGKNAVKVCKNSVPHRIVGTEKATIRGVRRPGISIGGAGQRSGVVRENPFSTPKRNHGSMFFDPSRQARPSEPATTMAERGRAARFGVTGIYRQ